MGWITSNHIIFYLLDSQRNNAHEPGKQVTDYSNKIILDGFAINCCEDLVLTFESSTHLDMEDFYFISNPLVYTMRRLDPSI